MVCDDFSATGARQVATLFPELKRQNKRVGVTTMCMGTGKYWDRKWMNGRVLMLTLLRYGYGMCVGARVNAL